MRVAMARGGRTKRNLEGSLEENFSQASNEKLNNHQAEVVGGTHIARSLRVMQVRKTCSWGLVILRYLFWYDLSTTCYTQREKRKTKNWEKERKPEAGFLSFSGLKEKGTRIPFWESCSILESRTLELHALCRLFSLSFWSQRHHWPKRCRFRLRTWT